MAPVLRSSLAVLVLAACTPLTDDGLLDDSADSGSAEGNSGSGNSGSGNSGSGGDEVPSNSFCDPVSDWDPSWSTLESQILDIVNARRSEGASCGSMGTFGPAPALTMNGALRCAARVHSKQMVDMAFFDHVAPWGEEPWDRMEAAGYSYTYAGENIAAGNATADATMQQWMGSDGHCSNIMSADFSEIGVGYFAGGGYGHMWTQVFGDR